MKISNRFEIPLFMSCSSFEYPDSEFILYTGTPRMLFAIVEQEPEDTEIYSYVEHENGESDYIVLAECLDKGYFDNKSQEEASEEIGKVMGELEEWYIAEIIDLDNYDE